jgi:hypothetical protein
VVRSIIVTGRFLKDKNNRTLENDGNDLVLRALSGRVTNAYNKMFKKDTKKTRSDFRNSNILSS